MWVEISYSVIFVLLQFVLVSLRQQEIWQCWIMLISQGKNDNSRRISEFNITGLFNNSMRTEPKSSSNPETMRRNGHNPFDVRSVLIRSASTARRVLSLWDRRAGKSSRTSQGASSNTHSIQKKQFCELGISLVSGKKSPNGSHDIHENFCRLTVFSRGFLDLDDRGLADCWVVSG